MKTVSAIVSLVLALNVAAVRQFTVFNNCTETIWPAIFTDLTVGNATPNQPTGWLQPAKNTTKFEVPDNWRSGRIWGRRKCNFAENANLPESCIVGGCNGGLECDPHTGTGVPPATLAEFTLGTNGVPDSYDVSMVDGHNLPMRITPSHPDCHVTDCPVNLVENCPEPLSAPTDESGKLWGCKTSCSAGLAGYDNSPNCCSGEFNSPAKCPSSGVAYYEHFKGNCPNAYAYAYDDATALFSCDSALQTDYTITFCPGP
ncbi:Osmotin thaumatin-like protein [Trametes versicolor FP-101664 SS1]|uniref:Osmotin thaumatin-like protein n=1 Tax=Trametes versicolor (strain FP-101664) TaxID=717944 RepID=UPI0004623B0B|nr:Osmotin thaumatin-like protein [Trametes versicolor FP-101664 SS1]EIW57351.1 Osmotin thaumatin-like protein [Trametes versicolor FP-101664 SS1]